MSPNLFGWISKLFYVFVTFHFLQFLPKQVQCSKIKIENQSQNGSFWNGNELKNEQAEDSQIPAILIPRGDKSIFPPSSPPLWFTEFQNQIFEDLSKIKKSLFQTHNLNALEKRLENTALSLSNGNGVNARKFWDSLRTELLPTSEVIDLASRLFQKIELTSVNRVKIRTLIGFINYIGEPKVFEILLDKIGASSLVHGGSEIFLLAQSYREICGGGNFEFYKKLPYIVEDITLGAVELKNIQNRGYLRYHQGQSSNQSGYLYTHSRAHSSSKRGPSLSGSATATSTDSSLWVFSLTESNNFKIGATGQSQGQSQGQSSNETSRWSQSSLASMEFALELLDDESLQIKIAACDGCPQKVGKYLGGGNSSQNQNKAGNDQVNNLRIEWLATSGQGPEDSVDFGRTKWTVEDSTKLSYPIKAGSFKKCI